MRKWWRRPRQAWTVTHRPPGPRRRPSYPERRTRPTGRRWRPARLPVRRRPSPGTARRTARWSPPHGHPAPRRPWTTTPRRRNRRSAPPRTRRRPPTRPPPRDAHAVARGPCAGPARRDLGAEGHRAAGPERHPPRARRRRAAPPPEGRARRRPARAAPARRPRPAAARVSRRTRSASRVRPPGRRRRRTPEVGRSAEGRRSAESGDPTRRSPCRRTGVGWTWRRIVGRSGPSRTARGQTTRTDASHVAENTARRAIPGRKLPACR